MSAAAVGGAGTAVGGHKRPRTEINAIGNKYKRAEVLSKLRVAKKKDRKARQETRRMMREELGDAAPPKEVRSLPPPPVSRGGLPLEDDMTGQWL